VQPAVSVKDVLADVNVMFAQMINLLIACFQISCFQILETCQMEPTLRTPMFFAARAGDIRMLRILLDRGEELDTEIASPWQFGRYQVQHSITPFFAACMAGGLEAARLLRQRGARLTGTLWSALHYAAIGRQTTIIEWLLDTEGMAVDHGDTAAAGTALSAAVCTPPTTGSCGPTVQMLLDHGADVNAVMQIGGHNVLYAAVNSNNIEAVRILLGAGATPFLKAQDGYSAVSKAAYDGSDECMRLILSSAQWVEASSEQRWVYDADILHFCKTPKTVAVALQHASNRTQTVCVMWERHSDTALHTAVRRERSVPLLCSLIKAGVDLAARNQVGQTAEDLALAMNQTITVQLLHRASENQSVSRRD
jgi:ankyrin repeat protein